MKTFTIYYFVDENEIPFYVGKTCNIKTRRWNHKTKINNGNKLYKYNKARKILNENVNLDFYKDICKIIETGILPEDINQKEIDHIKKLKEDDIKLTNLTEGGEGSIMTIPGMSEKMSKLHKGKKRSPETCRKISESNKDKPKSEEHKRNLKKAWEKRKIENPITEETKQKMRETSTGKINIKKFLVKDKNGNEYITEKGLTFFCKEHNLSTPNMIKVANGERKQHKGWTCKRI